MVRKKNYYLLVREFWKSPLGQKIKSLGPHAILLANYLLACARYNPGCKFWWNQSASANDLGLTYDELDGALGLLSDNGLLTRSHTEGTILIRPLFFKVGKPRRDKTASAWAKKKLLRREACCAGCGEFRERKLIADHVVSRRNGGRTRLDNLQLLCRRCNTRKAHLVDAKYVTPPGGFAV